ncbi:HAD family phosphatase [Candidatus Woesearchaeota archaeon]|nr:HAD family phosphatase [Candidatus Woesearchaeota archaeon]
MIKAVIFDMDGVIINSEPLHDESTNILLKKYNITIPQAEKTQFFGLNDKDMFKIIIAKHKLKKTPEELTKERELIYFDIIDKKGLELFPGILETIKKFSKRYKLAIATSAEKTKVDFTLKKFNLQQYFPVLITAEDIIKGKPDPEPYCKTIKKLNIKAREAIVIEDSVNGMKSALDAGCFCIAVTNTFSAKELKGADLIVNNVSEINESVLALMGI